MTTQTSDSASENVVNWFEIPVSDIHKATALYAAMLDIKIEIHEFGGIPHAILSNADHSGTSGALVSDPQRPPKRGGSSTVLYLNARDGVARCLARAVEAGARVIQPTTAIEPHGTIALVEDLDGNLVGLHAEPSK